MKEEVKNIINKYYPEEWIYIKLGDIANVKYGKANPKDMGTIPVVGSGGIYSYTKKPLVNNATIIIGRKGTAGKAWLLKKPCYPSDTTFYLEWIREVEVSFIYNFICFNPLSGEHSKTTLPSIKKHDLENYIIPLPPLSEQKKITEVLSAVQVAKDKTEAVIEAAKKLKKSLMKYLFTYGPVPINEAENVKLKETEIGVIPEKWEMVRLDKIFEITSGKERPTDINTQKYDNYNYPIYGGNGILGYSKEYFVDFDTIVIGRVGVYCGATYISPSKSWISDNALYAKSFLKENNLYYLSTALKILNLNKLKNTGGQPLISQSIVYSQNISFPTISEQEKIAYNLLSVDDKIETEENRKKALEELFKTLLNDLMTAKIRVNDLEIEI